MDVDAGDAREGETMFDIPRTTQENVARQQQSINP